MSVVQEWLTAKEVAKKLGLGVRTVRRMADTGHLPKPKRPKPRLVRWSLEELEEWMRDRPS